MLSLTKQLIHWQKVIDMSSEYIANNLSQLGEMNVVILKMRECLMDGYMGEQ